MDLSLDTVAQDPSSRCVQQRQAIERRLGAELLPRTDDRVGQSAEAEDRVLPAPEQQENGETRSNDRVEDREHIGADDAADAPAGVGLIRVGSAIRHTLGYLGCRESGELTIAGRLRPWLRRHVGTAGHAFTLAGTFWR